MVEAGEMGGFGGGELEHPRRGLGALRAGLFLGYSWECLAAQSRQVCPGGAQEPSWGSGLDAPRPYHQTCSALEPSATLTLGGPPAGLSYCHIMGGKAGTGVSREALCAAWLG